MNVPIIRIRSLCVALLIHLLAVVALGSGPLFPDPKPARFQVATIEIREIVRPEPPPRSRRERTRRRRSTPRRERATRPEGTTTGMERTKPSPPPLRPQVPSAALRIPGSADAAISREPARIESLLPPVRIEVERTTEPIDLQAPPPEVHSGPSREAPRLSTLEIAPPERSGTEEPRSVSTSGPPIAAPVSRSVSTVPIEELLRNTGSPGPVGVPEAGAEPEALGIVSSPSNGPRTGVLVPSSRLAPPPPSALSVPDRITLPEATGGNTPSLPAAASGAESQIDRLDRPRGVAADPPAPRTILSQPLPRVPQDHPLAGSGRVVSVRVSLRIMSDGSVSSASLVRSSGDDELDRLALAAARRWRFSAGEEEDRVITLSYDLR